MATKYKRIILRSPLFNTFLLSVFACKPNTPHQPKSSNIQNEAARTIYRTLYRRREPATQPTYFVKLGAVRVRRIDEDIFDGRGQVKSHWRPVVERNGKQRKHSTNVDRHLPEFFPHDPFRLHPLHGLLHVLLRRR